jgi:Ca2+-binding EF-hand superfamily protein
MDKTGAVMPPRSVIIGLCAAALASAPLVAQQPRAVAAPQSPDVLRAAFIATMDAEFRRRDTDGNGTITRAELERFEGAAAFAAAQLQNRDLFRRLDADRNGMLSPGEFAALVGAPAAPDVSAQMSRLDGNRDQQVSLIEYRAATLAGFDRLDTDHDGIVTAAELRAGNIAPAGR